MSLSNKLELLGRLLRSDSVKPASNSAEQSCYSTSSEPNGVDTVGLTMP